MLNFLNTLFLFALPLAALPVIIHLFNRRRRDVVRWGAMRFLVQAATRRRRIWRLSDLLLMLLRLAAIIAIVLALAQPLLVSKWLGSGGPRDVILVLDCSMSTAQLVEDERLFDRELEEAQRLIENLYESDTVRIMQAASTPEWLAPVGRPVDAKTRRKLLGLLQEVEPVQTGVDLHRCLMEALDAEPANKRARRMITLITDGQAHGWRAELPEHWQILQQKIKQSSSPVTINVICVGDPDRPAVNMAVQSLEASRTLIGPGERVVLTAAVGNCAGGPSETTLLEWMIGETELGVSSVPAMESGERTSLEIEHVFNRPGIHAITCQIDGRDDLDLDDTGQVVVEVLERMPVLVVDGSPARQLVDNESGYLMAALGHLKADAPQRSWRSVFTPTVIEPARLADQTLADYHVVVLANVDVTALPGGELKRLAAYVQQGGGVWIALGENVGWNEFNDIVYANRRGLSPVALTWPLGDLKQKETFTTIQPPLTPHPATRLLTDVERLDLDRIHIYRRHRFNLDGAGKDLTVLLHTMEGDPLAIEHHHGRGRIIVQSIPFNIAWSNLPICQSFVVMGQEWLGYLAEPTVTQWNLRMGEALDVALVEKDLQETAMLLTPTERQIELTATEREGQMGFYYSRTHWPGTYRLVVEDQEGVTQTLPFHVWRDVDESQLEPLDAEGRETLAKAGAIHFVDDPLADSGIGEEIPRTEPLWSWLLMALLGLLLVETLLGSLLTRRRMDRTAGLSLETDA